MAESRKKPGAKAAAHRPRPLGAALAACWYLLVYTHLASFALARLEPARGEQACSCAAMAGGNSCCSLSHDAGACALPDENMGCRGPRTIPASALLAAPCGGELPAGPQTNALTWPHLAGGGCALQPAQETPAQPSFFTQTSYSLRPTPPDKVPKQLA